MISTLGSKVIILFLFARMIEFFLIPRRGILKCPQQDKFLWWKSASNVLSVIKQSDVVERKSEKHIFLRILCKTEKEPKKKGGGRKLLLATRTTLTRHALLPSH